MLHFDLVYEWFFLPAPEWCWSHGGVCERLLMNSIRISKSRADWNTYINLSSSIICFACGNRWDFLRRKKKCKSSVHFKRQVNNLRPFICGSFIFYCKHCKQCQTARVIFHRFTCCACSRWHIILLPPINNHSKNVTWSTSTWRLINKMDCFCVWMVVAKMWSGRKLNENTIEIIGMIIVISTLL